MKYYSLLILAILAGISLPACSSSAPQVQSNQQANQAVPAQKSKDELSAISHSSETSLPTNATASSPVNSAPSAPPAGGSPNAQPVDVSAMNAEIEKAEKKHQKDPKDAQAKKDLAHAYFVRGFALTEAAQYRAALGDFRRGLKLDPTDQEAKNMHDQIISIAAGMGRELPKEGEEPTPLPFNKDAAPVKP
jgi:predicted component of type VI protein secretion system